MTRPPTARAPSASRATRRRRSGVTLVELLVALVVLGVVSSLAGLALHAAASGSPSTPDDARTVAARARASALRTGRPVTLVRPGPEGPVAMTAFPDGRVVGAPDTSDNAGMGESDASDGGATDAHGRAHNAPAAADAAR